MWGKKPHLALAEYWRWWVVHLWVEGVFEVFATAIISLLFVHMGLVRTSTATVMVLFATIIFLFGGVLGTFHHLYFTGTPISVIAAGASFSALEVVPLMVVGFEAYNHAKIEGQAKWEANYRWPFMFFAAVLFWNLVGAGIFGFLINPPLALYFMQGLNTTANHGHAALFGVYGMLGLGLTICLCAWADRHPRVESQGAETLVLVPEHWSGHDDIPVIVAARHVADLCECKPKLRLRPLGRIHAQPHHASVRVDAGAGRHRLQRRRRRFCVVHVPRVR
jgi:nitric oxide reductase large subunit